MIRKIFILMVFGIIPLKGNSTCQTMTHLTKSIITQLYVSKDTPVGTLLGQVNFPGNGVILEANCNKYDTIRFNLTANAGTPTNLPHVYALKGVPGIGISINTGAFYYEAPTYVLSFSAPGSFIATDDVISFYKVGDITSVSMMGSVVSQMLGGDNKEALDYELKKVDVITSVCSITTKNMSFNIGNVSGNEFKGTGSTSSTIATTNLKLDCDAGANVNITLNGNQNSDTQDTSVLALTGQGAPGVAEGIGVQLLYNDAPLQLSEPLHLKQSSGGQESFPITARYIQTKSNVEAGVANATATLDVTYQ